MTIDDKIRDEKLQCGFHREAAKISALSCRKIDIYEYFTDEKILPYEQNWMIEQAKFAYSPLGKVFEKQTETIKDQVEKQVEALEVLKTEENKEDRKSIEGLFPKDMRFNEIKKELNDIKIIGRKN